MAARVFNYSSPIVVWTHCIKGQVSVPSVVVTSGLLAAPPFLSWICTSPAREGAMMSQPRLTPLSRVPIWP